MSGNSIRGCRPPAVTREEKNVGSEWRGIRSKERKKGNNFSFCFVFCFSYFLSTVAVTRFGSVFPFPSRLSLLPLFSTCTQTLEGSYGKKRCRGGHRATQPHQVKIKTKMLTTTHFCCVFVFGFISLSLPPQLS